MSRVAHSKGKPSAALHRVPHFQSRTISFPPSYALLWNKFYFHKKKKWLRGRALCACDVTHGRWILIHGPPWTDDNRIPPPLMIVPVGAIRILSEVGNGSTRGREVKAVSSEEAVAKIAGLVRFRVSALNISGPVLPSAG